MNEEKQEFSMEKLTDKKSLNFLELIHFHPCKIVQTFHRRMTNLLKNIPQHKFSKAVGSRIFLAMFTQFYDIIP